jgi:geranylgeranyl diphosphate synthase type II
MFDLASYLRRIQSLVDARLEQILEREHGAPQALVEAMRYSLLAPGKRLRPALVCMGCAAAAAPEEQALPAACAVEMIHTYSLIHDDLPAMDDDDLRRGLPTCHKKFGEALAILAGDALLTLAFQVLAEAYPSATAAGCSLELARGAGAAGMVGGQVEDLAWERDTDAGRAGSREKFLLRSDQPHSAEALEQIHRMKTGALFRSCLRLGVWSAQGEREAGPEARLLDDLDAFASAFGLIFQITDDLLDVEASAEETGKRTGKDASRGKLTYPGLLGIDGSRLRARELAEQARAHIARLGDAARPLAALLEHLLTRRR